MMLTMDNDDANDTKSTTVSSSTISPPLLPTSFRPSSSTVYTYADKIRR